MSHGYFICGLDCVTGPWGAYTFGQIFLKFYGTYLEKENLRVHVSMHHVPQCTCVGQRSIAGIVFSFCHVGREITVKSSGLPESAFT